MRITKNWKNIISIALAALVLFGAVGAVAAFATNDNKPAGAVFKVGGLDPETGKYVDTDKTIYTEDAFFCDGLKVTPDFECTVTYDVYYYDSNDNFVDKALGLDDVYTQEYEFAQYARIVIHPEIPEDVKEKDFKIHFWDIAKYSSQIDITVAKDPETVYETDNLYNAEKVIASSTIEKLDTATKFQVVDCDGMHVTPKIEIDVDYDYYDIWVLLEPDDDFYPCYVVYNEDGTKAEVEGATTYKTVNPTDYDRPIWIKMTIEVDEEFEGKYFRVSVSDQSKCYIYGYND